MKKMTISSLVIAVLVSGTSLFSQESQVNVSPTPQVISVVGDKDVSYPVTRWPEFGKSKSDNETCANGLRANLSGKYKHDTHPNNYSKPIPQPIMLSKTIKLAKLGLGSYKKTARVIISWTIRIEAYQEIVNPWTNKPRLCHPWHGSIEEDFTGGEVDTMLYVDGKQAGNTATMTFPPLGSGTNTNASDPTITNSVTLDPKDLVNGEFPETFNLDIMWINKTIGSRTKAPAYMRSMTVFILPVGN